MKQAEQDRINTFSCGKIPCLKDKNDDILQILETCGKIQYTV